MKLPKLIAGINDSIDEAKHVLCDWGTAHAIGHGQNLLLNFRGETKHTHDLCHPGAGDPLLSGDVSLADDLAGLQEVLPLDGFSEEFDYSGGFRFPGLFGVASDRWDSA